MKKNALASEKYRSLSFDWTEFERVFATGKTYI